MGEFDLSLFVIQIIIILGLLGIIIWLIRITRSISVEQRIGSYAIDPVNGDNSSFFDHLYALLEKVTKKMSIFFKKVKIFDSYSLKYTVYMDGTKREKEDPMDYISYKFLSSVATFLVVLLSDVLQYKSITLLQVLYSVLIGFFLPDLFLISKRKLREKQIENELLKAVIIMNNAFKSGRSMMQAIKIVAEELDGPIKDEFMKMYIDLTFGLSLETVFDRFSHRVSLEEVKYMTTSLTILNQTGGNIVKVFSSIERSFFSRRKLQQELKSLTASANAIFKILVCIPVGIFFLIFILNPDYFTPLITNVLGFVLLGVILIIYISYIIIIKKVMTIKED